MPSPTLVDPSERETERWDDPARGPIRWRTLLSAGLTDTDTFTAGIASLSPGDWLVEHRHAEPEIYVGLAGEADVVVDGVTHRLAPERVLYIPGDALHAIPVVAEEVRFLYCFARDAFGDVAYSFPSEAP